MLLLAMFDTNGNQVMVNGENIAWYMQDKPGKGSVVAFAVPGEAGFATLKVTNSPDEITTLINAKLRK